MRRFLVLTAEAGVEEAAVATGQQALADAGLTPEPPRRLAASAVEIGFIGDAPSGLGWPGIDANVMPEAGRRKRLLLADMDSTIIGVECIDELADFAGVKPEVAAITQRAMRGELDFPAALAARVALLEGLPEAALERTYAERVRLNPGARVLGRTMAALGPSLLVSGGFTFFAERVAAEAGFAEARANRLEIREGRLTGRVVPPVLGREAKLAALRESAAAAGVTPAEAVAVGDGANDLAMVAAAGLGVAYRAKAALAGAADARLDHSDLTAVLALQGIPEREWLR